ncbi:response regulator [Wenjunlia vitaminophila]|uniref:Response regulator n=1 Tax=Wenjunlia vitaminophila TaxID=76728 RepID=A0A0T6LZQ1_WENVI|nr:response regulator [Wenjunlia vitaminophila]
MRSALLTLRRVSGLPVAFGGFFTAQDHVRISELTGNVGNSLRGLAVAAGNGLGGKAAALARPVSVADYPSARTISHEYDGAVAAEGMRALVAVPVIVRRTVRAVLYGGLRQPQVLGDRTLTAVVSAARELEQRLVAREEAQRMLSHLGAPGTDPAWEEVRQVHAELRALAVRVGDETLRARLHDASARLAAAAAPAGERPAGPTTPGLSPREIDVLAMVARGRTNADTAEQLGLRTETVKSYLRSAMRKLGAHTRLEAVVTARRTGQLP